MAVDINGGALVDVIFGSNRADNIRAGAGADTINITDAAGAVVRDRLVVSSVTEFGDVVTGFKANSSASDLTGDRLLFSRDLLGLATGAAQFNSTNTLEAAPSGGLLGTGLLAGTPLGGVTESLGTLFGGGNTNNSPPADTRIHQNLGASSKIDADDVIGTVTNAGRAGLGLTATDLEGDLTRLLSVVNTQLKSDTSKDRVMIFFSNDVDTIAYQFQKTGTGLYSIVGGQAVVKLLGVADAAGFDQFDFELLG